MPERKSHVKSRLGCTQCKGRRVKCDEIRPACGNCKRRQESCSYKNANPITTPSPEASGLDQTNGIPLSMHLKQLELMHHYCTSTYETISMGPRPGSTQLIEIPRLALQHEFLLDTVFALTCLHLAYLNPTEGQVYLADATRYHSRALVAYRQRLENLQASECRALYHTSAKLGVISLAFRALDSENSAMLRPTESLTLLSTLWRGTSLVLSATKELIDPQTYEVMFPLPDWDPRRKTFEEESSKFFDLLRYRVKDSARSEEEQYRRQPNGDSESPMKDEDTPTDEGPMSDPMAIYFDTIDQLQGLFQLLRIERSRVLAWLVFIPAQFHDYLGQRRPIARAIIMLFSTLLQYFEQYWWSAHLRKSVFEELADVVSAMGPDMAEMVHWVKHCERPELATID